LQLSFQSEDLLLKIKNISKANRSII